MIPPDSTNHSEPLPDAEAPVAADATLLERLREITSLAPSPESPLPESFPPPVRPDKTVPADSLIHVLKELPAVCAAAVIAAVGTLIAAAGALGRRLFRRAPQPGAAARPAEGGQSLNAPIPPEAGTPAVSRGGARACIVVFLLLITLPPLLNDMEALQAGQQGWLPAREFFRALKDDGQRDIAMRLKAFENKVESASFTRPGRQAAQSLMLRSLHRGNDKTLPGLDGWLFFRPEIEALTSYGPLVPEPESVAKDPSIASWRGPLEPVREFVAQLNERGVAVLIVPVPVKPSIYPEKLTGSVFTAPVRHRDATAFYDELRKAGASVLDLAPVLWEAKNADDNDGPVYLPQDTHWSPRGMIRAALAVATAVQQLPCYAALPLNPQLPSLTEVWGRPAFGDLVEKLDLAAPANHFAPQRPRLLRVQAVADRDSPVVLLGDSFVNIYDDASLGFATEDAAPGQPIGAGFAQHLALQVGCPLDVHAANGEGATGVRAWLARRGESVLRSKKLVIWVISERDFLLPRSLAVKNNVHWRTVNIAADPAPVPAAGPDRLVVEATVIEKSPQADPRRANYAHSLYTVKYEVTKSIEGAAPAGFLYVVHWNFKDRQPQPAAAREPGKSYQLELRPWTAQKELQSLHLEDMFDEPDPRWWGGGG